MTLRFHNTLTGRVDEFVSQTENKALIYTCGPTVYDNPHIGNWVAYIYWDVLVRTLIANNYEVNRVMNITDVGHLTSDADEGEDKLEKGARRENKTAWEIAETYTQIFLDGMQKLNMIMPTTIAKATDFIPQQIDLIRKLKQAGYTYRISDGIYYDTSKFPTYADFAHLNLDELKAGARVEYNTEKRNISDFALWKFTPAGEKRDMEWDTPADLLDFDIGVHGNHLQPDFDKTSGLSSKPERSLIVMNDDIETRTNYTPKGFPGWHLECSAISLSLLGKTIDIHTGGIDHIPVHHTNEIAQSEAATGVRFVNYWLHNNHLKVNGTKISKSLQNGYTLQDLEDKGFSMQDFRMFVLQGNYKSEGNFTIENLTAAKNRLDNWRNIAALRHQTHDDLQPDANITDNSKVVPSFAVRQAIIETISNDLDTPKTLQLIDEVFMQITKSRLENISQPALVEVLETIDELLGLELINSTPDITDEAKRIILERRNARENKNWKVSDELRDNLLKMNIAIRDTEHSTVWEYKN